MNPLKFNKSKVGFKFKAYTDETELEYLGENKFEKPKRKLARQNNSKSWD